MSALRIAWKVARSSKEIRDRSIRRERVRAMRSTQRSTAESIPSPSRSIFRKPASAQESLSHCTICRPAIAAGTTGQQSISGRVASTIPPECWERWRGNRWASATRRPSQAQRGEPVGISCSAAPP